MTVQAALTAEIAETAEKSWGSNHHDTRLRQSPGGQAMGTTTPEPKKGFDHGTADCADSADGQATWSAAAPGGSCSGA